MYLLVDSRKLRQHFADFINHMKSYLSASDLVRSYCNYHYQNCSSKISSIHQFNKLSSLIKFQFCPYFLDEFLYNKNTYFNYHEVIVSIN